MCGLASRRSHTTLSSTSRVRGMPDPFDDLARKRVNQHPPGRVRPDAASAQVENRFVVQLADGRAVRAFHVVGVNFQLRLGIDAGILGKQQILVGLLGVGFLGDLADQDAAVENAPGPPIEDAIEILVAVAVGLGVLHHHVVIRQLLALGQVEPVEDAFHALAGQSWVRMLLRESRAPAANECDTTLLPFASWA